MRKNKLYFLISIVTLICLFGTAAICNQIGGQDEAPTIKLEVSKGPIFSEENESQEDEEEILQGEPEAPEISIFVYEGPTYSAVDDVCYYRIASEVYGNPYPKVTWSKDDSDGTLGWDKVQVNLRRGETYTLIATATNSEDTKIVNLTLSWGCNGEEVGEDEGNGDEDGDEENTEGEILELEVPIVNNESGQLTATSHFTPGTIIAGDNDDNESVNGFMSFNILSIQGADIEEAILKMNILRNWNDPSFYDSFYLGAMYWGEHPPDNSDYSAIHEVIQGFPSSGDGNIICSNTKLKEELQKAINEGLPRFQIRAIFAGDFSDYDNEHDAWVYNTDDISLKIKYIP